MIFKIGAYDLDVDVEKTRVFYKTARYIGEGCNCAGCRNYNAAVDSFPQEVSDFFCRFGVDLKKPAELMIPFSEDNGKTLKYWRGFYHVCGKLLCGYDYNAFEGEGIYHIDKKRFHHIAEGYYVGFSNYIDLLENDFPVPALQIEIDFSGVPWVLDEKNPYVENSGVPWILDEKSPFAEKPSRNQKGFFSNMIEKRRKNNR